MIYTNKILFTLALNMLLYLNDNNKIFKYFQLKCGGNNKLLITVMKLLII